MNALRARRAPALLAAMIAAAALPTAPRAGAADPITGTWQQVDEDGEVGALVALAVDQGAVVGRITKVFPGPGEPADPVCDKCPGALRGKPVLGLTVVRGLKPEGRHYAGGRILDPETGEDYDLQADLSPDGQTLSVRAYRGLSLLGRSQTWRRAP
jgi:uncharacterized protein (DUF2147 family)